MWGLSTLGGREGGGEEGTGHAKRLSVRGTIVWDNRAHEALRGPSLRGQVLVGAHLSHLQALPARPTPCIRGAGQGSAWTKEQQGLGGVLKDT